LSIVNSYPRFYPPYESCVWNIEAGEGQVIQIDILDVAIREPESKTSVYNRKKVEYKCTDRLLLTESKSQTLILCGEVKSNLLQYRTKSNALTIDFTAFEFSPTRGILFRYSCNQSFISTLIAFISLDILGIHLYTGQCLTFYTSIDCPRFLTTVRQ